MYQNIVVIGSSGAIGGAFISHIVRIYNNAIIHAFSRSYQVSNNNRVINYQVDYFDENLMSLAIKKISDKIDFLFIATGRLHDKSLFPEKTYKDITIKSLSDLYLINAILPTMMAKLFIPLFYNNKKCIIAALSARVGSISDNNLGGWYSYRASKAALNMIFKSLSIEMKRINKNFIIITLHPGTVDSDLSKPFQNRIKKEQLFSADFSVKKLFDVIDKLTPEDSGKIYAWDGREIKP